MPSFGGNAFFISSSEYISFLCSEHTDAVIQPFDGLPLAALTLPAQVSTTTSCNVLGLCHPMATALAIGFWLSRKQKDLTDHWAKHQESISLLPNSERS